jgi:hypothetical protein
VTLLDARMNPTSVRALLSLVVVFVMLATTGWTALRPGGSSDPRSAAVSAWKRGTIGVRKLPALDSAPGTIARFFASLTGAQRRRLADRYALVVGNLNGAPIALRYRANAHALRAARAADRARAHSDTMTAAGRKDAARRAARYTSLLSDHRQILAFDPTGNGLAAEVFGDLAGAKRVAVVVPGVDTNVLTFERTDRSYAAPVGMAEALHDEELAVAPRSRTAVIAWADYTTPTGVGLDASTAALAERGATRLEGLLSALPQRHDVALFCHSYGSVLCGVAAPDLAEGQVSDITVFGSPGMRARNVGQLHTGAHIWAARDSGDWISDVPHLEFAGLGHGADPVSASFGARVISAAGAQGHPGYFAPDTASLANFTEIALGDYAQVACNGVASSCTAGLS